MTVTEQLRSDITGALKAGEKERVGALRLVLSELQKAEKEGAGVSGRLNNPAFKDRAPADVVEKTQRDLAAIEERLAKLRASLERLKAL